MIVEFGDGKLIGENENDFRNRGLSSFKGWLCSSPLFSLNLTPDGDLTAGICRSLRLGNLFNQTLTSGGLKPFLCPREWCTAIPDISCPKKRLEVSKPGDPVSIRPDHPETLYINWDLGRRCNYDCWYCLPEFHNASDPIFKRTKIMSGWLELLRFLGKELNLSDRRIYLSLLGGEPTLIEGLQDIVVELKSVAPIAVDVMVMTNGSRSAAYLTDLLKYAHTTISVHLATVDENEMVSKIRKLVEHKLPKGRQLKIKIVSPPGTIAKAIAFKARLTELMDASHLEILLLRDPNTDYQTFSRYSDQEYELLGRSIGG